ncbi:MAG: hypothetical protein ACRBFS_21625 [Aureispira sp.]
MKKYTHNNAGVAIADESRIYVNDGFGEACIVVPFACIKGYIASYPIRPTESLEKRLIKEVEKEGHLVLEKTDILQHNRHSVRDSGDIVLELSVPAAETAEYLHAYIGISANYTESIASYPMFEKEIEENSKLTIGGDFGQRTMDQLADLAKNAPLELTKIGLDGEDDNFIKEKLVYSGKQSDGDRIGDTTFRFRQNDIYTENTEDRQMKLGANTEAGVVIIDGLRYLKVKVVKGSPVSLTLYYNRLN